MSSGVILLQRPYISFSSLLLLILRREITAVAVALLTSKIDQNKNQKNIILLMLLRCHYLDVYIKRCLKLVG